MSEITNSDNVIDLRDVIARIKALEDRTHCDNCAEPAHVEGEDIVIHDAHGSHFCDPEDDENVDAGELSDPLDEEELQELKTLQDLASEADVADDWEHGAALIRDSYFQDYAEQLADELGLIKSDASWPYNCIDWEQAASELQVDYFTVDFDGVQYWVR